MGGVKKLGGAIGGATGGFFGSSPKAPKVRAAQVAAAPYDVSKEVKGYQDATRTQLTGVQDRSQFANQQNRALMQQLSDQASGRGPSLAEAQLRAATNRNLAQQLAMAAGARGGNAALQQRQLMQAQGQAGRQLAMDGTQARLQEAMAARQQLGNMLGQEVGSTDTQMSNLNQNLFNAGMAGKQALQRREEVNAGAITAANTASAQLAQQQNLANQQVSGNILGSIVGAGGQMLAMSDEEKKKSISESSSKIKDFLSALSGPASSGSEGINSAQSANLSGFGAPSNAEREDSSKMWGKTNLPSIPGTLPVPDMGKGVTGAIPNLGEALMGLMPGTGGGSAMAGSMSAGASMGPSVMVGGIGSDERTKNGKKPANMSSFLDALSAKQYEYKHKGPVPGDAQLDRSGRKFGIMAQDLEKSEVGKSIVRDTPQGKMVDVAGGLGVALAAQADLHKRLKALEGKKKA